MVDFNTFHLTTKEGLFANYYMGDAQFNATKAAILAGYSEKTARQIGHENLTKPYIRDYIKSKSSKVLERFGVTQETVLEEIVRIAFSDVTDIFDENWKLRQKSSQETKGTSAIKSLQRSKSSVSIKNHDKVKALLKLWELVKDEKK